MGTTEGLSTGGRILHGLAMTALDGVVGLVAGAVALVLVLAVKRLRGKKP
jgi:predicted DNA repair protein MutK